MQKQLGGILSSISARPEKGLLPECLKRILSFCKLRYCHTHSTDYGLCAWNGHQLHMGGGKTKSVASAETNLIEIQGRRLPNLLITAHSNVNKLFFDFILWNSGKSEKISPLLNLHSSLIFNYVDPQKTMLNVTIEHDECHLWKMTFFLGGGGAPDSYAQLI